MQKRQASRHGNIGSGNMPCGMKPISSSMSNTYITIQSSMAMSILLQNGRTAVFIDMSDGVFIHPIGGQGKSISTVSVVNKTFLGYGLFYFVLSGYASLTRPTVLAE